MLLTTYKNLMKRSTPLLEAYLSRRMQRGKEDPLRFPERRGQPSRARGTKPLVWLHAASVGESQSLLVLIQRLLRDYPDIQVMVTTGTVTSAKLMAERLPTGAFHQYMPVDHPDWTESFLNHWQPDLVIWSESEFWPNMLTSIRERRIPAVLLNARMSEKSFRQWHLARNLIGGILKTFTLCLAQNPSEAHRLRHLGAPTVAVSGNLKYAALPLPYDPLKLDVLKDAIGDRPYLLWASTHPGEEKIACRIHKRLQKIFPSLLTIIVPRHPQRGADIAALVQRAGLRGNLRSEGKLPEATHPLYIADTLGELGLFYQLCRLCILGGSFVSVGGHNPIEPAQFGCQIFYGPHMFNFITICDDFESRNATQRIGSIKELEQTLTTALQNPAAFSDMADAAQKWTQQQSHIVDDIATQLTPFLNKITVSR